MRDQLGSMKANNTAIHYVVALDVTEQEVRSRIAKRRTIENRVDDVLLAAPLRVVVGENVGQRDPLAVDGEDEVAVDEDVDGDRMQPRRLLVLPLAVVLRTSAASVRRR